MSAANRGSERREGESGHELTRGIGRAGRTAVLGAVAGGVALGGFAVAGMSLGGRISGSGLLLSATALFLVGAVLGFGHGGVLGFFGREDGVDGEIAVRSLAKAALYAIPALAVAWVVAGWIALTVVARFTGEIAPMVGVGLGWLAGAALVAWAASTGWQALRRAYARWRSARVGTFLVAATFAALMVVFQADHPEIWWLDVELNAVGAVLAASAATLWIVGPLVTLALRALRSLPDPRPSVGPGGGARAVVNLALGLAVGAALALVALPFHHAPLAVPAEAPTGLLAGVTLAVSHAMVEEILLRLAVLTGAVWLMLRWGDMQRGSAAVAGVAGVAVLQLALYLPALGGVGFPSATAAAGYAVAGVLVPAVAFGALYWFRGFSTALVADATAIGLIALLV